jgi:hypothetical protein
MLQRPVFILNLCEGTDLAFEADGEEIAEKFCRTPWFVQAVDRFRAHKTQSANSLFYRTRPATAAEASMYRQVADEFAELGPCMLVANLGDLSVRAKITPSFRGSPQG